MLNRKDRDSYNTAILNAAIRAEGEHATPQSVKDFNLLRKHRGGFTLETQIEELHYAAILLRAQGRVEEVDREDGLCARELVWCALYPHLRAAGYTLPLRYAPYKNRSNAQLQGAGERYDRPLGLFHMNVLPALCKKTGEHVALKITCSRADTPYAHELDILRLLNAEPLRGHPDNHAVRLLDVVAFPAVAGQPRAESLHVVVMPILRPLDVVDCALNGFALHLMLQTFRAVAFLHSIGICHRDIGGGNLMMTATAQGGYRLQIIDFGCAQQFDMSASHGGVPKSARVRWTAGQIPPPEVEADPDVPYDPFSAEIFSLAETWRMKVLPHHAVDLLSRMSHPYPAQRPPAAVCKRDLEQAISCVPILDQCRPTDLFAYQLNEMAFCDSRDFRACARHCWTYVRAVVSYVICRGWKYLR